MIVISFRPLTVWQCNSYYHAVFRTVRGTVPIMTSALTSWPYGRELQVRDRHFVRTVASLFLLISVELPWHKPGG